VNFGATGDPNPATHGRARAAIRSFMILIFIICLMIEKYCFLLSNENYEKNERCCRFVLFGFDDDVLSSLSWSVVVSSENTERTTQIPAEMHQIKKHNNKKGFEE
jgi:hypothetical protein